MYLAVTTICVSLFLGSLPSATGSFCGPPPVVTNSSWTLPCVGDKNEMCHFVCDWGFKANGLTYTHCKDDGHWSDPGRCSIIHCGELPTIENGDWKRYCENKYGASCDFVCNDGYISHGGKTTQCLFDGLESYWTSHGGCVGAPKKSVAPPKTVDGAPFFVFCDANVAGVTENAKGIVSLELSWKGSNEKTLSIGYSHQDGYFGLQEDDSKYWGLYTSGINEVDRDGLFNRRTFKMRILVRQASTKDNGKFCCEIAYYDSQSKYDVKTSCQDVEVGNTAIVHPSVAIAEESVAVTCNADLAGVPIEESGLEFLMLTWTNQDMDPKSILVYEISVDPGNKTNTLTKTIEPNRDHTWSYIKTVTRQEADTARLDRSVNMGINISAPQDSDSGWFCCAAGYVDALDFRRYTYRCQYILVDKTTYDSLKPQPTGDHFYSIVFSGTFFLFYIWLMIFR